jgi:hypothetical protein
MRIALVNISPGMSDSFLSTLQEVSRRVCRPSTEVTVICLDQGTNRMSDQTDNYVHMLTGREIVEKFLKAERDGYDACITD